MCELIKANLGIAAEDYLNVLTQQCVAWSTALILFLPNTNSTLKLCTFNFSKI